MNTSSHTEWALQKYEQLLFTSTLRWNAFIKVEEEGLSALEGAVRFEYGIGYLIKGLRSVHLVT